MSVFLSNVDDYVAPAQACVNPLFSQKTSDVADKAGANTGTNNNKSHTEEKKTPEVVAEATTAVVGVKRKARVRRPRMQAIEPVIKPAVPESSNQAVTASLADCLACSGCVTTAETQLIERQNVAAYRAVLDDAQQRRVATISPAAWADLRRHAVMSDSGVNPAALARCIAQALRLDVLLDGNLPLAWSLDLAAQEFCQFHTAIRQQDELENQSEYQRLQAQKYPSRALSATQTEFYLPNGTRRIVTNDYASLIHDNSGPVLSSSCPAVVCLVETSAHDALTRLSHVRSPLALAGAYLKKEYGHNVYHVGIMPCHDKKLEASRLDFASDDENKDMDLVLTSSECWELVAELLQNDDTSSTKMMEVTEMLPTNLTSDTCYFVTSNLDDMTYSSSDTTSQPFVLGSGGYADFIFRYAAKHLYGTQLDAVSWKPVEATATNSSTRKVVSARVANQHRRRRDFFEANLYEHTQPDGSVTYSTTSSDGATPSKPVLRFAIAYGMQTLQRILNPLTDSYDYVEAMACPSGCLNGGGQLRVADRETPTETRQRLLESRSHFSSRSSGKPWRTIQLDTAATTQYHLVPPLQHTLGATSGVAVKDMQW